MVYVGEKLDALVAKLVDTAVNLLYGSFGIAKTNVGPANELAWVFLDDLRLEIVHPRGPVVGLSTAQHLRAGDAVVDYRQINTHLLHVPEFLLNVGVNCGGGLGVATVAADEIGPAAQNCIGQVTTTCEVLQVFGHDEVAVDVY